MKRKGIRHDHIQLFLIPKHRGKLTKQNKVSDAPPGSWNYNLPTGFWCPTRQLKLQPASRFLMPHQAVETTTCLKVSDAPPGSWNYNLPTGFWCPTRQLKLQPAHKVSDAPPGSWNYNLPTVPPEPDTLLANSEWDHTTLSPLLWNQ